MVNVKQIKDLREKTGVSIADCRNALEASNGNEDKALEWLKTARIKTAEKKGSRALGAGAVASYIHSNGTLGALVELRSETDFVAKNEAFRSLAEDLAMQISATAPVDLKELLDQPFIKDPSQTINDLIKGSIQKFGERIEIGQFTRLDAKGD